MNDIKYNTIAGPHYHLPSLEHETLYSLNSNSPPNFPFCVLLVTTVIIDTCLWIWLL
jgi:hypothetical protein